MKSGERKSTKRFWEENLRNLKGKTQQKGNHVHWTFYPIGYKPKRER